MVWVGLRVALVAISLALDVFAVCIGVGIRGVSGWARFRIAVSFAGAEIFMNLVGAGIGAAVGHELGAIAGYIGFAALVGVGGYMVYESLRDSGPGLDLSSGWGLMLASLSISLDSLGIGFSIVYLGVPIWITLTAIAVASVASTVLGLSFGRMLGKRVEERAGIIAGFVLAATGILFAALKYFGAG